MENTFNLIPAEALIIRENLASAVADIVFFVSPSLIDNV